MKRMLRVLHDARNTAASAAPRTADAAEIVARIANRSARGRQRLILRASSVEVHADRDQKRRR